MDRAHGLARSDKLTKTEHVIDDHVVAVLERPRMELLRRTMEAQ